MRTTIRPAIRSQLARAWQAEWLAGSRDRNWRFPDRERPFVRVPTDPSAPAPDERWNVVIIQLESVRGVDTGHLRPDRAPSPTPYLDALAARPDAAVWTRALSFGPPSINGRFALQCSITPSSRRFITSQTLSQLLLPARRAARAGLSRRDVQRRRHRHGQQHDLGACACTTGYGAIPRRGRATARSSATPPRGSARWGGRARSSPL